MPRGLSFAIVGIATVGLFAQSAARPSVTPRDTPSEARGAAAVRGRVVAAADGHPLANARVSLRAANVRARLEPAYTDRNGQFALGDLPAGRYTIRVSKAGYVLGQYGDANGVDGTVSFDLSDGSAVSGLDLRLVKAGAISGRVVDDIGDPIVAASVVVGTLERSDRELRIVNERDVVTDDLGEYRIGDLPSGTYVVRVLGARAGAILPGAPDEWRRSIGWTTTFYAGATTVAGAQRLTLQTGQDVSGIDFVLRPSEPARLSILATNYSGNYATGTLVLRGLDTNVAIPLHEGGTASIALDAGTYVAWNSGPPSGGMTRVSVGPGDANLVVNLAKAGRMTGRIIVEGGAAEAAARIPLALRSVGDIVPNGPVVKVNRDGTFAATDLFGPVEFFLRGSSSAAVLEAVTVDGRNILDAPADFGSGEELAGVEVRVNLRPAEISGVVVDAEHRPAVGCSLLVFPDAEEALRSERLSRWSHADVNGRFQVTGLVAGSYFVAAARDVDPIRWSTAEFLAQLRARSRRVALVTGERKALTMECGDQPAPPGGGRETAR